MSTVTPAAPVGSKPGDKWEPKVSMDFVTIRTDQVGTEIACHMAVLWTQAGAPSIQGWGRKKDQLSQETVVPYRHPGPGREGLGPQAKEGEAG